MSRSKKFNKDIQEKLISENIKLKKYIKELEKEIKILKDIPISKKEKTIEVPIAIKKFDSICPKCHEGRLTTIDINVKKIVVCSNKCGFRSIK